MSVNPLVAEHVPHCYPGEHGAVHECGMVFEKQFEQLLRFLYLCFLATQKQL